MEIHVHSDERLASRRAADELAAHLVASDARTLVAAGGNSPLELYRLIAGRRLSLPDLHVFTLDEYVGVPPNDPRTCGNLLRRSVAKAWNIPDERFHSLDSQPRGAWTSIQFHEMRLQKLGGIDILVLGLGRNGHLGFNEPPSPRDAPTRVVDLAPSSVAANREWFHGAYAPELGVTLGMSVLLAARRILVLAFGEAKAAAVHGMAVATPHADCPASWLQEHSATQVFLDDAAAARLPSDRLVRGD